MLLQRSTVIDHKTGIQKECVILQVCGSDGQKKNITLEGSRARRFEQINLALRSYGGLFEQPRKSAFDSTDPLAWNISELAYLESKMLKRLRMPTFYEQLMPLKFDSPPWATSIETFVYDEVGVAELEASDSTEMPFADARYDRIQIMVKGGKIGYHYDIQEMIESVQLKKPLTEVRMASAVSAYKRHMNKVALKGEVRTGQKGLWNQAGVTPVAAATGAWDNPATSVLGIIDDIVKPIAAVHENSMGQDFVTHVALPLAALSALSTRILTVTTGGVTIATPISVLEYIKQNNVSKLHGIDIQFVGLPVDKNTDGTTNTTADSSLYTAGTLAHDGTTPKKTSRVVFYVKDPDRIVMHIPLPLNFLAPQPHNTDIVVPGRYRFTAPKLLYAMSMYYLDCVLAADVA